MENAAWFLRIAEAVGGHRLYVRRPITVAAVKAAIDQALQDAEDDGNPWDASDIAAIRRWKNATPTNVAEVRVAVLEAATEAMQDHMLDMVTGDEDGTVIRAAVRRAFDRAVSSLR